MNLASKGSAYRPVPRPSVAVKRVLLLLLLNTTYLTIFLQFFPNQYGGVGHDYAYWFPRLIAGAYWYMQNGWLSIPWFTPALNGGNLLYADPESIYFSFPQLLTFFVDPLSAITITFAVFSAVGMLGTYWLLRNTFQCSFSSRLLGAALFLFNGLFTYRMIVGHLPFHAFMLLPWMLYCILRQSECQSRLDEIAAVAAGALLLAYCFYAGGIHFLIPVTLSMVVVGLIYGYVYVERRTRLIWQRLGCLLMIAIALCASKGTAAFSVIRNVPREAYSLPGISNIFDLFMVPMRSLFFSAVSRQEANQIFENLQWALDRHEFEYGITFVPLLLLAAEIGRRLFRRYQTADGPIRAKAKWLSVAAMLLMLLLPIVANYYSPRWNMFLKSLPVIKSSSTLLRWYAMYIPIGILLAALMFEKIRVRPAIKNLLAGGLLMIIVLINLMHDKSFSYVDNYDYHPISRGFSAVRNEGRIPVIEYVGLSATVDTPARKIIYEGENLINIGVSYLLARSSLFGYRLEFFPQKDQLKIGHVRQVTDGHFNMINPSCYLFPEKNGCAPGVRFRSDQADQLAEFVAYRPFEFEMPVRQRIANWMTLATLLVCILVVTLQTTRRYLMKSSRRVTGSKPNGRSSITE